MNKLRAGQANVKKEEETVDINNYKALISLF